MIDSILYFSSLDILIDLFCFIKYCSIKYLYINSIIQKEVKNRKYIRKKENKIKKSSI